MDDNLFDCILKFYIFTARTFILCFRGHILHHFIFCLGGGGRKIVPTCCIEAEGAYKDGAHQEKAKKKKRAPVRVKQRESP